MDNVNDITNSRKTIIERLRKEYEKNHQQQTDGTNETSSLDLQPNALSGRTLVKYSQQITPQDIKIRFEDKDAQEEMLQLRESEPDAFDEIFNARYLHEKGYPVPKFTKPENYKQLVELSKENKELFNSILYDEIDYKPRFGDFNLNSFWNYYKQDKDLVSKTVPDKNRDGSFKYSLMNIDHLIRMKQKHPEMIDKLISINPDSITIRHDIDYTKAQLAYYDYMISKGKKPEEISLNIEQEHFSYDKYKSIKKSNNITEINYFEYYDSKLKPLGTETIKDKDNNKLVKREFPDGSYSIQKVKYVDYIQRGEVKQCVHSLKKSLYNNEGICVRSEVIKPSKDLNDAYTITVYERGLNQPMKKTEIGTIETFGKTENGSGKTTKPQGSKVIKTLKSEQGDTTKQTIITEPNSSSMNYEIINESGNTVLRIDREFQKIDENHTTSSLNGQKYYMEFIDDKILATKLDNNDNVTESILLTSSKLTPEMKDLYKQLPGDFFFKIHDLDLSICVDPTLERGICHYDQYKNSIVMAEDMKNNPFVFAHELGHAIDIKDKKLSDDYYMDWQFRDEYQDYKQKTSDTEVFAIDYFVDSPNHQSEIVAETYALLSGLPNTNMYELGLRSLSLQQHFPKTISYISEKII